MPRRETRQTQGGASDPSSIWSTQWGSPVSLWAGGTSIIHSLALKLEAHAEKRARWALERVGLGDRTHHKPNELSGGQQQRVAIARSLVNDPRVIMADEPTGALDTRTSFEIMGIFQELNREGKTVVMVTHENDIAQHASRIIRFRDGRVYEDSKVENPKDARVELEHFIEEQARHEKEATFGTPVTA